MGLEAFSSGLFYDSSTQSFVSAEHERVARAVMEYNPYLRLHFIPEADRVTAEDKEAPFAVFHYPPGGEPYPVFLLQEKDINLSLIDKLYAADQAHSKPIDRLESLEAAAKKAQEDADREKNEEMHDRAKSIFRTPLHTYRVNKDKKVNL